LMLLACRFSCSRRWDLGGWSSIILILTK